MEHDHKQGGTCEKVVFEIVSFCFKDAEHLKNVFSFHFFFGIGREPCCNLGGDGFFRVYFWRTGSVLPWNDLYREMEHEHKQGGTSEKVVFEIVSFVMLFIMNR
jgi:hypothetical protein